MSKVNRIARFGMLTAVALVLGYLENFVVIAPGIPGIKLGLSNIVLLYALYEMDWKSTAALMLTKVFLSGFLFAGPTAIPFSLMGGVLSIAVMLLAMQISGVGIVGVSVCGAAAHNIGQLGVACLVVGYRAILSYSPILLAVAVGTGILTGIVAKCALKVMEAYEKKK